MRPQSTHWLRPNHQERSPHRVLVVDTETRPASDAEPSRQVLRLWAARLTRRHGLDKGKPRTETYRGRTAAELVELVDSLARSDYALWLMTHNLNFDLAVTELPVLLTERDWRITEAALTTDSPWCRMIRGSRRLTIADTFSWLPASVETLGDLLNNHKLDLPEWGDSDDAWYARCEQDVAITADAIEACMAWWDAGRYGNWSITGPATGWSSYRHHKPTPRVLIIPDPDARALEMRAVTGGRREVRRLGQLPRGLYADLDLTTAHLTAMAGIPLPSKRIGRFSSLEQDHHALDSTILDVLAECIVTTSAPRYPWDSGRGVFYPVGTFRSVLSGPEIREARRRGELVSIGQGYLYLLSMHMESWALWLARLLDAHTKGIPAPVRLMAKHWSRCVPGKWAGHTSDVLRREPDPRPGWAVERAMLMPEQRPADILRIGGERWTIVRDEWADDAFPAVLAWIQGATRVAIGRLVDQLGSALVSINTDGVLVDVDELAGLHHDAAPNRTLGDQRKLRALDLACQEWDRELDPFSVRIKGACARIKVISPQHTILDDERRLAGIPKRAKSLGYGRYAFTQWPKLRLQLARPEPKGYTTRDTTVDLAHIPPTGWLTEAGDVIPVQLDLLDNGDHTILPPAPMGHLWPALQEPARQHPILRGLAASAVAVA